MSSLDKEEGDLDADTRENAERSHMKEEAETLRIPTGHQVRREAWNSFSPEPSVGT